MKKIFTILIISVVCLTLQAQTISIVTSKNVSNRELYAKEYLEKKLTAMGYTVSTRKADKKITLINRNSGPAEGYQLSTDKKGILVSGNDGTGVIYGCVELADCIRQTGALDVKPKTEQPDMVMREDMSSKFSLQRIILDISSFDDGHDLAKSHEHHHDGIIGNTGGIVRNGGGTDTDLMCICIVDVIVSDGTCGDISDTQTLKLIEKCGIHGVGKNAQCIISFAQMYIFK